MKDIHEWSTTDTFYAMGFVILMFMVISFFCYLANQIEK
jgi:preprotein translocase subunit SecE